MMIRHLKLFALAFVLAFSAGIVVGGKPVAKVADAKVKVKKKHSKKKAAERTEKLPIMYSSSYDISFFGIEGWLHSFDGQKYGKVYRYLQEQLDLSTEDFYEPSSKVSDKTLLKVHSQKYLDALSSSSTVQRIIEVPVALVPNFLLQWKLLDPMRYATQGTIDCVKLALKHGWAINLSGGYHHAKAEQGEGFCVFADISLAIKKLRKKQPDAKVLIVDLDAHRGNGHESIHAADDKTFIFDIYNDDVYPYDIKQGIDFDFPVCSGITTDDYLNIVKRELPKAIDKVNPDFIIYNAGTDIFEKDGLGRMKVSKRGIIKRDALMFKYAIDRGIPILMVLSGGYTQESAGIIGESIMNIVRNIL